MTMVESIAKCSFQNCKERGTNGIKYEDEEPVTRIPFLSVIQYVMDLTSLFYQG